MLAKPYMYPQLLFLRSERRTLNFCVWWQSFSFPLRVFGIWILPCRTKALPITTYLPPCWDLQGRNREHPILYMLAQQSGFWGSWHFFFYFPESTFYKHSPHLFHSCQRKCAHASVKTDFSTLTDIEIDLRLCFPFSFFLNYFFHNLHI